MTILITPTSPEEIGLWRLAREVTSILAELPWVLVGGLMVRILEAEHGVETTFTTSDVDAVLDVRAVSTATRQAATRLQAAGFEPEPYDGNLTYRFRRGRDIVDVLAPDNIGSRASLITVPPGETLEALGGRQALNRRRLVTLDAGDGPFEVPLPSLVGAIVIKARVAGNVQNRLSRPKHERDLARLLALVKDPKAARAELTRKEQGYLRERGALTDPSHRAWRNVTGAEDGVAALLILGEATGP